MLNPADPVKLKRAGRLVVDDIMRHITLPESMDIYLQKFTNYYENVHGTPKMKEYNYTHVGRVKAFLYFVSLNQQQVSDWKFLYNIYRIRQWIEVLQKSGKKNTVRYYLQNATHVC